MQNGSVDEAKCAPVYDSSSNVIPYNSIKLDNTGVKVGNDPKGEFTEVMTITRGRVSFSERFSLFIGNITLETVIRNIVANVHQVDTLIKTMLLSILSKWIIFHDDGTLEIKGNVKLSGDVEVAKVLKVEGTSEFNNEIVANSNVEFNNTVKFTDDVTLHTTSIIGKATFNDNITVSGNIYTTGSVKALGDIMHTTIPEHYDTPSAPQIKRQDSQVDATAQQPVQQNEDMSKES